MKTREIRVVGKVQGVWFRKYTQNKAQELNLNGFVRNEQDGSVFIVAQGEDSALDKLEAWCHEGSPKSSVESVVSRAINTEEKYSAFNIEHR